MDHPSEGADGMGSTKRQFSDSERTEEETSIAATTEEVGESFVNGHIENSNGEPKEEEVVENGPPATVRAASGEDGESSLEIPDQGCNIRVTHPQSSRESFSARRKFSGHNLIAGDPGNSAGESGALGNVSRDQGGRKLSVPAASQTGCRGLFQEELKPRQRSRSYGPGNTEGLPDGSNANDMTEETVEEQAEEIIHSFMVSSYQLNLRHEMGEPTGNMGEAAAASPGFVDETPNIPELTSFPGNPLSPATLVGRRLAHIGDEFQARYERDLDELVNMLLPHLLCVGVERLFQEAYDAFRNVASKIFAQGEITWGRIVALFCFGYRMAVALFRHGLRGFVGAIVGLTVKFLIDRSIRITRWIAERGGWRASSDQFRLELEGQSNNALANNWFWVVTAAVMVLWIWSSASGRKT